MQIVRALSSSVVFCCFGVTMSSNRPVENLPMTYPAIAAAVKRAPAWLLDYGTYRPSQDTIINPSEYPEYAAWSRFFLDSFNGEGLIPMPGGSSSLRFDVGAQQFGEAASERLFLSTYNGFIDAELMDGWVRFDWDDAFMLLVDDTPDYREYIRAAVIADGDIAEAHARDYAYSVEQFVLPYRVPGHRQVIDRPFRAPILRAPDVWAPELRFPKS
jgi:hypothetical protein